MQYLKRKANLFYAFLLTAIVAIVSSPAAMADDVTDAITATETLVTSYVTAIGGALVGIAVLWIGFKVGAKYVRKLSGL